MENASNWRTELMNKKEEFSNKVTVALNTDEAEI